jgi:hypothetical protein
MTPARYQIQLTDGTRRREHVVTTFSYEAAKAKAERRAWLLGRQWRVVKIEEVPEAA